MLTLILAWISNYIHYQMGNEITYPFPNWGFGWWRHQMETFSTLLTLCERNPPVTGGFPSQSPATRSFGVFFDLCLNKRLSKQSRCRWFDTPTCSLWRQSNAQTNPPGHFTQHQLRVLQCHISYHILEKIFILFSCMQCQRGQKPVII